jgi:hypothetical protein
MRARIEAETAGARFRAFIVEPEDADKKIYNIIEG